MHKQTNRALWCPASLFIIHNLLRCQGQSDRIVMVKGKLEEPEVFTWSENPGEQNKPPEV